MPGITGLTRINNEAANGFIIGATNTPQNIPESKTAFLNTTTITIAGSTVDLCLVGGGGGGGGDAGGGGGGMVLIPAYPITPGNYTITIGSGGGDSTAGTNTTLGSLLTALGGGQGLDGHPGQQGGTGGSGGGIGRGNLPFMPGGPGVQPSSPAIPANSKTYGFGNPAGNAAYQGGSGGGGAGAASNPAPSQGGSPGGSGKDVSPVFGAAPQPYYPNGTSTFAPGGNGRNQGGGSGTNGLGQGGSRSGASGGNGIAIISQAASVRLGGVWRLSVQYNARLNGNWI
jgi:hypothetical protein